ncbi:uncharacterized protein LOC125189547 [Salvia hispanica]|uniref:uncharacterized protein LOC125189547 n=1 Tax=Salvia hispanica TaxID=49212 RepID=UPI0020097AB7|nr:uncharacterized protein LOC125189547 [Salvia hispanica]
MNMFNHGNTVTFPEGPRIDANNFELRMTLIQRVEQTPFAGRATEDANRHLSKFVEIANTLKLNGVDDDAIRNDIVAAFLDKYYPPSTILKLKSEIFQFFQGHDEPLYEAFARFKALLRKCPNHGANGGFLRRSGEDAMAVIEESAANSRGWSKERHSMKRIVAIEEAEESSFAKELAELKVRVDQMDTSRKEDPIPPTSIIAVSKIETPVPVVEEINYMQGGGSNRNYNNNYRPNQGGGFSVGKGGVVETSKKGGEV